MVEQLRPPASPSTSPPRPAPTPSPSRCGGCSPPGGLTAPPPPPAPGRARRARRERPRRPRSALPGHGRRPGPSLPSTCFTRHGHRRRWPRRLRPPGVGLVGRHRQRHPIDRRRRQSAGHRRPRRPRPWTSTSTPRAPCSARPAATPRRCATQGRPPSSATPTSWPTWPRSTVCATWWMPPRASRSGSSCRHRRASRRSGLGSLGADLHRPDVEEMLSWPESGGPGRGDGHDGRARDRRMVDVVAAGIASGKLVSGHAASLVGPELRPTCAPGSSVHEIFTDGDVMEKVRSGADRGVRGMLDHLIPLIVAELDALGAAGQHRHPPPTACSP